MRTYTDKYLIHNITNKQFKRKYIPKNNNPLKEVFVPNFGYVPIYERLERADQAHLDSIKAEK